MVTCTLIQTSGFPCTNESDPASFFDICSTPWAQIIEDHKGVNAEAHTLAEVACPTCRRTILTGPGVPAACSNPYCWEDAWWNKPAPDVDTATRKGTDWVYYIRFGDRIKIGTSSSIKGRLSTLPHDEILALEPGGRSLERERCREFSALRIDGQRAWFQDTPALRTHADRLRAEHGEPNQLVRAP
ncbi:GIY-YIG nuclease family protein [Microbacterium sp. NPDC097977]|uniref:GIY-YIG nuclease family protein n=1 Tax=Microbacterium sp. NPDC097977 TaxID=3155686 RepID=UPI00333116E7